MKNSKSNNTYEIKIEDSPLSLAEDIINDIKFSKEKGLLKCVQCGMCTSTCPAAQHSNYNPRDMIERVLEGDKTILEDDDIWNCFYCYTCHSICPVGNSACEINQILKQISISEGKADEKLKPFLGFADSYYSMAIGAIPSNFFEEISEDVPGWWDFRMKLEDIREELGLGTISPPQEVVDEVSTLLDKCGFKKCIDKIREADE
ncbi:MAG: 4Fe-4S dicluster domain-containing protein [archaeon]|nr:4Fe-4S dicluster domain-containing protein [archaeon]